MFFSAFFAFFAVACLRVLSAAPASYSGRDNQLKVAIPRIDASATIDGLLEEEAWRQAARLTDFSQYAPVDGRPAGEATEVLVWYSATHIYFGVRAHAAPGSVHATLADRDKIDADDSIQIFLSTFNDGRRALMFAVNPLGVQADGALSEGTGAKKGPMFSALESSRELPDLTPDYVFASKGRVHDEGFDVEIAIPFKTLPFPGGRVQDWSINVVRRVQSTGQEHTWTPAKRASASFLSQSGTLVGLTDLHRGLVLDMTPIVTAKIDGAAGGAGGWSYRKDQPEPGANIRWGVTPNLTLNGTINPDFSQVEADAGQVVFDPRSSLFFPEKRPFFLENAELFSVPNNLIYTRRIRAPLEAMKLTGKVGATNLAVLSAADDKTTSSSGVDHALFTIARIQQDLGARSKIGVAYTERRAGIDANRVFAGDARLLFGPIYSLQLQAGGSWTRSSAGEKAAPMWHAVFSRDGKHFGFRYLATGLHQDFQAGSGFISRGGIIHANANHRGTWFGSERSLIQSWTSGVAVDGIWQYKGVVLGDALLEQKLHFNNTAKLKAGWAAGASVLVESFAFDQQFYSNHGVQRPTASGFEVLPFPGTPHLHNLDYVLTLDTPQFSRFSASVLYLWGRDENFYEWSAADIVFATYSVNWRPTNRLRISPQYQLQQYDRVTDGTTVGIRRIPRLKIEQQISRPIFVRFIGEYDSNKQDDLRDDSRTNLPIVVRDPATGLYTRVTASERNAFRVDLLFSYQPTPGTVFFAGYSSALAEPQALRFSSLSRTTDGFFMKLSYLFRL